MLTVDRITARRFILGKQGLWPGRRWRGTDGTEQAMRDIEYLQLDPLQVIARSQDIALHSRVFDYAPEQWQDAAYGQRQFFDWGGWLATRPMSDLPYWRVVMQRERDGHPDCDNRVRKMGVEHAEAIAEVRELLRERGTLTNRDFDASARKKTQSYRGRKDSALALYYLWRVGEVMTHHREGFERVYALAEAVAPAHYLHERDPAEVDRFLIKKDISFEGISRLSRTADSYFRGVPFSQKKPIVDDLLTTGDITEVKVEGLKPTYYVLAEDVELIEAVAAGRIPQSWEPIETTTQEEVSFLAPLDPTIARGRAKELFGFDYVWEVYKPADKRIYGYYTLPILWGDNLVARFDSRFDRAADTFTILGFWLEDDGLASNDAFVEALARGFSRFVAFLGAAKFDSSAIVDPVLRRRLGSQRPRQRS